VPSLTVLSENGDFEVETDDLISERAMLTVIYAISHVRHYTEKLAFVEIVRWYFIWVHFDLVFLDTLWYTYKGQSEEIWKSVLAWHHLEPWLCKVNWSFPSY
jgi:hypothetical protein